MTYSWSRPSTSRVRLTVLHGGENEFAWRIILPAVVAVVVENERNGRRRSIMEMAMAAVLTLK